MGFTLLYRFLYQSLINEIILCVFFHTNTHSSIYRIHGSFPLANPNSNVITLIEFIADVQIRDITAESVLQPVGKSANDRSRPWIGRRCRGSRVKKAWWRYPQSHREAIGSGLAPFHSRFIILGPTSSPPTGISRPLRSPESNYQSIDRGRIYVP